MVLTDVTNGNSLPVLLVRNSAEVELPVNPTNFDPTLLLAETCPCAEFPDDCCEGQAPTTYDYDIGLPDPVPIGGMVDVDVNGRNYGFSAFDAFASGACGEPLSVAWSLIHDQ